MHLYRHDIEYLTSQALRDASDSKVEGSYTKGKPLVYDGSTILVGRPESIEAYGSRIEVMPPGEEFREKVEKAWVKFKKTEKGKNAFNGVKVSINGYTLHPNKNLSINLRLNTYADFFMSYQPQFTQEEKRQNYVFGVASVVMTSDDKYVFSIRSSSVSSAAGTIDQIGGFMELTGLVDPELEAELKAYAREGTLWQRMESKGIIDFPISKSLSEPFNLEKYEELGIRPEDINRVEPIALTETAIYQNHNLLDFVTLTIDEARVRERYRRTRNKEISGLIFVPEQKLPDFLSQHRESITPNLKNLLRAHLLQ